MANSAPNDTSKDSTGSTVSSGFKLTANGKVLVNDPHLLKVISAINRGRNKPGAATAGS